MTSRDDPRQPQIPKTTHTTADGGYRRHRFTPPPGACELLLIRHGESQPAFPDRPLPLTDGHADEPDSRFEMEMALRIRQLLENRGSRLSRYACRGPGPGVSVREGWPGGLAWEGAA